MAINARTFLNIAAMIFRRGTAYRVEWIFGVFQSFLYLWVQIAVWQALLTHSNVTATGTTGPVTMADMVTYLILVNLARTITREQVAYEMEGRLRTGDIVHDLLKPVGFPVVVMGRSLGQMCAGLLSRTLPSIVLAAAIWGIQAPVSVVAALGFVAAVAIGVAVNYALGYLFGILGFYTWSTEHFQWILNAFFDIVSGAVIPFWFLPGWVRAIGNVLPFHTLAYTPVAIYLGKVPASEAWALLGCGALWAAALWAVARWWWAKAVRRIVLQGG